MKIVELSGGVGGARMARALASLDHVELTVVVNVGDDAETHGIFVSPDVDTVVYTLAGIEGPQGWGRAGDTYAFNDELGRFGLDNTFQIGDRDLALKWARTRMLADGISLSEFTGRACASFGVEATVIPASDAPVRTMVETKAGTFGFQEYFVHRGHRDEVTGVRFEGADRASPAPGVIESIADADAVVIAPSNPPLSIWPILAIPGVRDAVAATKSVTAISPLIGGAPVKGPADRVLRSLGFSGGNTGVLEAYDGLVNRFVIDTRDADQPLSGFDGVEVLPADILIKDPEAGHALASALFPA